MLGGFIDLWAMRQDLSVGLNLCKGEKRKNEGLDRGSFIVRNLEGLILWSYFCGGFVGHKEHMKNLTSALFLNSHSLVHSLFIFYFYFLLLKEQNPGTDVENVEIEGKWVRQPAKTDVKKW